jgi:hypothetical protein
MLGHEIHLVARPDGLPRPEDFALVAAEVPEPDPGQVRVKNLILSVDPYMRPRLAGAQALGEAMEGGAIGRVEASRNPAFAPGDLVLSRRGLREAFVDDGGGLGRLEADPALPLSVYLHALGGTGFTAYGGLLRIAALADGEQVFVSTAAGAVGSVAAQIARIRGCHVIGSTGSDEKVRWLIEEAGLDAAINYRATPIGKALRAAAAKGVDVYFDNVGGDHLDAALACMNKLGRIAVCGAIRGYNAPGARTEVRNLAAVIYGRITLRGFTGADFPDLRADFRRDMTAWLKSGQIVFQETVREGLAAAPEAFIGLFRGENAGKMLVRLAD